MTCPRPHIIRIIYSPVPSTTISNYNIIFPGTGTPEPGGITFKELQEVIGKFRGLNNIVGCDIVELAPNYDHSGASTAVCAKAIRELLLVVSN